MPGLPVLWSLRFALVLLGPMLFLLHRRLAPLGWRTRLLGAIGSAWISAWVLGVMLPLLWPLVGLSGALFLGAWLVTPRAAFAEPELILPEDQADPIPGAKAVEHERPPGGSPSADALLSMLDFERRVRSKFVFELAVFGGVMIALFLIFLGVLGNLPIPNIDGVGIDLPLPTRMVVTADAALRLYKLQILVAVIGSAMLLLVLRWIPTTRRFLDAMKFHIPVVGRLLVRVNLCSAAHRLLALLTSGVGLETALREVEAQAENAGISQLMREARFGVIEGVPIWTSLSRRYWVPDFFVRLISLSEHTGDLQRSLRLITDYYDVELPRQIRRTYTILEPLLLVSLAGLVLFAASAVFLPWYGMISAAGE